MALMAGMRGVEVLTRLSEANVAGCAGVVAVKSWDSQTRILPLPR